MSNSTPRKGLKRQVGLSLFSAIIVVLTVLGNFVRFGPVPITLSLAPIIIGAAVYGSSAGALLGGVFGLVVLLGGIFGWDGGTVMLLMGLNPIGCILICIGKGILAGYLSGLAYRAIEKKSPLAAVVTAGIVCPVVNTARFLRLDPAELGGRAERDILRHLRSRWYQFRRGAAGEPCALLRHHNRYQIRRVPQVIGK